MSEFKWNNPNGQSPKVAYAEAKEDAKSGQLSESDKEDWDSETQAAVFLLFKIREADCPYPIEWTDFVTLVKEI